MHLVQYVAVCPIDVRMYVGTLVAFSLSTFLHNAFCSDKASDDVIGTAFLEIPQISVFSDSSLGMLL